MHGRYEWKLNDRELKIVYDGNIGDYIPCSMVITTPITYHNSSTPNGDIQWNLSLYPKGNDNNTTQYAYLSIHTRSIPNDILNIYINYTNHKNQIKIKKKKKKLNTIKV
eukprot:472054_1